MGSGGNPQSDGVVKWSWGGSFSEAAVRKALSETVAFRLRSDH